MTEYRWHPDSYEEYDALEGVRWTNLAFMAQSPAHYQEALARRYDNLTLRLGRAVHCALLEPDVFRERFVCYTGGRRDKRIKAYQAFLAEHRGADVLTTEEMAHVVATAAAVRRHPVARRWIEGAHEQTVVWTDPDTGLRCKARCDTITVPKLVELKSTQDGDPRRFANRAAGLRYHCGLAFHLDGARAAGHELDPEPLIIVVESRPPYDCQVFSLIEHAVLAGRNEYRRLLQRVAECNASGQWPGRSPAEVVPLALPEWAYTDPSADPWGLDLTGLEE